MARGRFGGAFCGMWVGFFPSDKDVANGRTFGTCHEWWDLFWGKRTKAPSREDRAWNIMLDDMGNEPRTK